jgi:hypothetical protein
MNKFPGISLEPIPIIGGNQDRLPTEQKTVPASYGGGLGLSRGPASRGAARAPVLDGIRDADGLPDNTFHEPSLNWDEPDFTIDDSDFSNYSDPADADFSDFEDVDLGPSGDLRPPRETTIPGRYTFRPTKRQKVAAAVGAGAAAAAAIKGAEAAISGIGGKAQGFKGKTGGGTGTPQQQIPQPPQPPTARPQPAQQTPQRTPQRTPQPTQPAQNKPQPAHVLWDGVKFEYPSSWFDVPNQLDLVRESLASYSRVKTENADMRAR